MITIEGIKIKFTRQDTEHFAVMQEFLLKHLYSWKNKKLWGWTDKPKVSFVLITDEQMELVDHDNFHKSKFLHINCSHFTEYIRRQECQ